MAIEQKEEKEIGRWEEEETRGSRRERDGRGAPILPLSESESMGKRLTSASA